MGKGSAVKGWANKHKRVIFLAVIVLALLIIGISIFLLINKLSDRSFDRSVVLSYKGKELTLGQRVTEKELQSEYGFVVAHEVYDRFINPEPDPNNIGVFSEDRSVEVYVEYSSGKYTVRGWSVSSKGAKFCGLKVGDPAEKVREVFPKAELYLDNNNNFCFFHVNEEGEMLSSQEIWKLYEECDEEEKEELLREYALVRIHFKEDEIVEFEVRPYK